MALIVVVGLTDRVVVASAIGPAVVETIGVMASKLVLPADVVDVANIDSSVLATVVGGAEVHVD